MKNYSYIALSPEYKKLTGIVKAETEQEAKEKLHKMSLSLVNIKEVSDEEVAQIEQEKEEERKRLEEQKVIEGISDTTKGQESTVTTFYFQAVNKQGKTVNGTIDSTDIKVAYKRLVSGYHFKILFLCKKDEAETIDKEQANIELERIKEEVSEEFGIEEDTNKEVGEEDEEIVVKDEKFLKKKEAVSKEIDKVAKITSDLLIKFEKDLKPAEVNNIQDKLGELLKLKMSNNLNHLQKLTIDLFQTVADIIKAYNMAATRGVAGGNFGLDDDLNIDKGYQDKIKALTTLTGMKKVSSMMKQLLSKESKEVLDEEDIDKRSHSIYIRHIVKYYIKSHFAKSDASKNEYSERLKLILLEYKRWRKKKVELENLRDVTKNRKSFVFFQEIYLFMSFVTSFYILYFFSIFYLKYKLGHNYEFIDKSLSASSSIFFGGVIFLIFLMIVLKMKFARMSLFRSLFIYSSTFILMILFFINF